MGWFIDWLWLLFAVFAFFAFPLEVGCWAEIKSVLSESWGFLQAVALGAVAVVEVAVVVKGWRLICYVEVPLRSAQDLHRHGGARVLKLSVD